MNLEVRLANKGDIFAVEAIYDSLNDYLEVNDVNYPGWKKGVYPTIREAEMGLAENSLFVAIEQPQNTVVGSVMLNHEPYEAFSNMEWIVDEGDYSKLAIMRTLVVDPSYLGRGVAKVLVDFATDFAKGKGLRAIRLGVTEGNTPAAKLYEQAGYQYIGKADLGFGDVGLPWFWLYELPLN